MSLERFTEKGGPMKLEKILKMNVGPNSTRIRGQYPEVPVYSVLDLEDDLFQKPSEMVTSHEEHSGPAFTKAGNLLISIIKEKACIVSEGNGGKLFTSAFIRCQYDEKILDPWFFCFFFNESEEVGKIIHVRSGMPGLGYYHLNTEIIGQIEIDLPPLEKQKTLGSLYQGCLKQLRLYDRKKEVLKKAVNLVINEELEKKGN